MSVGGRVVVSISAAVLLLVAVVVILITALVPLPQFGPLQPSQYEGGIAFVDTDNCIFVARLETAETMELRCEPERGWIDDLQWTDEGLELTTYLNQPTTKVIDPSDGTVLATRIGDQVAPRLDSNKYVVDSPERGTVVLTDASSTELLRLQGPERYWIDSVSDDGSGLISLVDTHGRLAIFELPGTAPTLVAQGVRSWPAPVWEPRTG